MYTHHFNRLTYAKWYWWNVRMRALCTNVWPIFNGNYPRLKAMGYTLSNANNVRSGKYWHVSAIFVSTPKISKQAQSSYQLQSYSYNVMWWLLCAVICILCILMMAHFFRVWIKWHLAISHRLYNFTSSKKQNWQKLSTDYHNLKVVLHLLPKISMFCALPQNNQHLYEK